MDTQTSIQPHMAAPKSHKTLIWIIITIILTAGIVGGGVYYYLNQQSSKDKAALQSQINTLNQKLAAIPSPTPLPTVSPSPVTTPATVSSEDTLIKNAAIAYAEAQVGTSGVQVSNITKSGANFAQVSFASNSTRSGGGMMLKKVNGIWFVIYSGTQAPDKNVGTFFGMPSGWYNAN